LNSQNTGLETSASTPSLLLLTSKHC